jgi:D-threo-aldose 1-dehydrogenase
MQRRRVGRTSVKVGVLGFGGATIGGVGRHVPYDYRPATETELLKASRIEQVCRRYDVPLVAAALQFPLAHPAVAAVIPGPRSAGEVESNVRAIRHPIPVDLWRDLKRDSLLREDATTPADEVVYAS